MRPFYKRLTDIPELAPLTPAERTEVWSASAPAIFRFPVTYLVLLVAAVFSGLAYAGGQLISDGYIGILLSAPIGSALGVSVMWYYSAERLRPILAETIEKRKLNIAE